MMGETMSVPIFSKILFTITYPAKGRRTHVPLVKLHSLAKKQLSDTEVIETIDHLFACQRCFEVYRFIRTAHVAAS
jgi:hypothetical protein